MDRDRAQENLVIAVGKVMNAKLIPIGHLAVREVVTQFNNLLLDPDMMPYAFWSLTRGDDLPTKSKKRMKAINLMVEIMEGTKTMPNWASSLVLPGESYVETALDLLALKMGAWALRTMYPLLFSLYKDALNTQARNVYKATGGGVSKANSFEYMRLFFREVLGMKSAFFQNARMLRHVISVLPI